MSPPRPPEPPHVSEEPAHVSEETTLVREEAEAGAEDGAGAEVHVSEPWSGYDHMNADEVIARLADATSAELTAVRLYEGARRGRETVIEAVDQALRRVANQP